MPKRWKTAFATINLNQQQANKLQELADNKESNVSETIRFLIDAYPSECLVDIPEKPKVYLRHIGVRMNQRQFKKLQAVARVTGGSISNALRFLIDSYEEKQG